MYCFKINHLYLLYVVEFYFYFLASFVFLFFLNLYKYAYTINHLLFVHVTKPVFTVRCYFLLGV